MDREYSAIQGRILKFRGVIAARLLALLSLIVFLASVTAVAADRDAVKQFRDAHQKFARDDLSAAIRESGEVRVIVGLETPDEIAQIAERISDQAKEQAVAARQLRLLQRNARHNAREKKQPG